MRNVLVVFENRQHLEDNIQRFAEMLKESLGEVVSVQMCNDIITTNDTVYKLIGAGFPYVNSLGDKLNGLKFDDVMIHGDVVLTIYVDRYLRTRMKESKQFIEFEV